MDFKQDVLVDIYNINEDVFYQRNALSAASDNHVIASVSRVIAFCTREKLIQLLNIIGLEFYKSSTL